MLSFWQRSCFFQAEDGIRDVAVTGVQTCALPISAARARRVSHREAGDDQSRGLRSSPPVLCERRHRPSHRRRGPGRHGGRRGRKSVGEGKRVDLGGRRIINKKKETKWHEEKYASS